MKASKKLARAFSLKCDLTLKCFQHVSFSLSVSIDNVTTFSKSLIYVRLTVRLFDFFFFFFQFDVYQKINFSN